jgi:AcrR family transcriptional regulator
MGRPQRFDNAELLAAARAVFARDGLAAPVKEIAAELGVSEAAVFKRYPTKADLIAAAMVPPPPDIAALLALLDRATDPQKAMLQLLANLMAHFRAAIPVVLPVLSEPGLEPPRPMRQAFEPALAALTGTLSQRLAVMIRRGELRSIDPVAAAGLLITTAYSLAMFEIMGFHGGTTPPRLIEGMVEALWRGLEPQASRGTSLR